MELLSIDKSVEVFYFIHFISVAVTNSSTVVCFFKDMQLVNATLHQNSKLDSFTLGLAFQIENLLSCRNV